MSKELDIVRTPTAQELKKHFLDIAWPIVDSYVNAALGVEELKSTNAGCREEVWELVKKLMLSSSDKMNLEIESPRDVILAVEEGKCTFKEAEQLLDLYQRVKEIESEQGGIISEGHGGIQVNILSGSSQPLELPQANALECIEGTNYMLPNGNTGGKDFERKK